MKRMFTFILIFTMTASVAMSASPSDQTFRDLETQILKASISKDAGQIDRLLASDYISVGLAGQIQSKAEIVASYSSKGFAIKAATEDKVIVRRYGDLAIVVGNMTLSGTFNTADISGTYAFTRVYRREGSAWRAVSYQATPVK